MLLNDAKFVNITFEMNDVLLCSSSELSFDPALVELFMAAPYNFTWCVQYQQRKQELGL